jgi:hypothetical protein
MCAQDLGDARMIRFTDELVYCGQGGGSNRHTPRLALVQPGKPPVLFEGRAVPGVVRIDASKYYKQGKWSYTDWTLTLAPGFEAWTQRGGTIRRLDVGGEDVARESRLYHDCLTWAELKEVSGASEDIIRLLVPKTAERLDANAQPV